VQCAPGETTDLASGEPGSVTYQTVVLSVSSILAQMTQTGLAHAAINDVLIQNGVTTTAVSFMDLLCFKADDSV